MVKKLLVLLFLIIFLTAFSVLVFGPNYAKSYVEDIAKNLLVAKY